jgi:hypothetical protein
MSALKLSIRQIWRVKLYIGIYSSFLIVYDAIQIGAPVSAEAEREPARGLESYCWMRELLP